MPTLLANRAPRSRLVRVSLGAVHCSMSALMLLAACADGTRSAPTAPGAPHAARVGAAAEGAAPMRPIRGRCESVLQPFPDPLPPQFTQRVTGTCQLAHLGRVT